MTPLPVWNIEHPEIPVYLRGKAGLRASIKGNGAGAASIKQRPGETRKIAERWGRVLQGTMTALA